MIARFALVCFVAGCANRAPPYCTPAIDSPAIIQSGDDSALALVECCVRGAHVQRGFDLGTAVFEVRGVSESGVCTIDYAREVELSGFDWARCEFRNPVLLPERDRFTTGEGVPPNLSSLPNCTEQ